MAVKDGWGSGLLIRGKKEVDQIQVPVYAVAHDDGMRAYVVGTYPMDGEAKYVYQSRAGGFVPPSVGGDTCFSQLHYGQGGFEGMRFYYSRYGLVLPRPWANHARLFHTATTFHPLLAREAVESIAEGDAVSMRLGMPLTPDRFYDLAKRHYRAGGDMTYPLDVEYADGRKERLQVRMALQVAGADGAISELNMAKLDTVVKVLGYTGGLVSVDHFPKGMEMTASGYVRPWIWVSGEAGLKLSSVFRDGNGALQTKPMYFACATLPWGLYLTEEHYATGLDVMLSPYERIDDRVMPATAKVAGDYLNQLPAINLGQMLGYGEILTFTRDGKFVEGSVENAFVLMREGKKIVAYTPPVSDGCLPGTTRDAVIRTLGNMGIEVRYQSLELSHLYEAKGILFTGTGAQLIHVRSITELEAPGKIAELTRLRSEEQGYVRTELKKSDFSSVGKRRLINRGERHPIVAKIQDEYGRMLMRGKRLEPVHNLDFRALGELVGVDTSDFMDQRDKHACRAGYFEERVNGLKQPDELRKKTRRVARIISRAMGLRANKGILLKELDRRIERTPGVNKDNPRARGGPLVRVRPRR